MELYLMQHGEARAKEEDPDRPLTDAGQATVERVAQRAAGLGLRVDAIYHSGILRARQTAEIVNRPRSWPSAWVTSKLIPKQQRRGFAVAWLLASDVA